MKQQNKIKLENIAARSSGILLFFLLWELSARFHLIDTQFLPPISVILNELIHLLISGELLHNLLISLWRIICSLLLAAIIGIPLGILLQGWFPRLARDMDSFFRLLSHVNPFSLSPLFLVLFGVGEIQKLAVISIVALWPILFHTITGVRSIEPAIIKTARSMKTPASVMSVKILLPAALPTIMTGLRISTQLSVFMLTGVEMLDARTGLGALVHGSAMSFDIPRLYAGGVLIILLGIALIQLLALLEKQTQLRYEQINQYSDAASVKNGLHGYYIPLIAGALCSIIIFGGQLVRQTAVMPEMDHNMVHGSGTSHHMNADNSAHGSMDHHHMDMEQNDASYDVMLHPPDGGPWPPSSAHKHMDKADQGADMTQKDASGSQSDGTVHMDTADNTTDDGMQHHAMHMNNSQQTNADNNNQGSSTDHHQQHHMDE
ncbi:ABC transporter permease [Pectinatus haikarae]|uniref:NitT/TauT family transport system permease protein n=1 Tax=Pectinatus haikarae TaxID=349096 RepID=A0ABT9Y9J3_9FIRM|nr:ABC transporter permease [Pectinatus haikarae]MDQ0204515.1 NitT/TauT family transport system permease protein [Pectinatus haikarae]